MREGNTRIGKRSIPEQHLSLLPSHPQTHLWLLSAPQGTGGAQGMGGDGHTGVVCALSPLPPRQTSAPPALAPPKKQRSGGSPGSCWGRDAPLPALPALPARLRLQNSAPKASGDAGLVSGGWWPLGRVGQSDPREVWTGGTGRTRQEWGRKGKERYGEG